MDYESLLNIINTQKLAGTAALTVCGTTGESVTMTPEEQHDVIRFAVNNAGGMTVIAGAGTNDTSRALDQAAAAQEAGADGVLIVTPYYNRPTQRGLIEHFTYIADRVDVPVILYNVPSRTGSAIAPETLIELSGHPNINGIKEASGNLDLTSAVLTRCPDKMNVWSGNDDAALPLMALGAVGVISVAADVIPWEISKLTRLCLQGDFAGARAVHREYYDLMRALFTETNPIPVKTALSMMGQCREEFRLPLCPMGSENRRRLKSVLLRHGLIRE